MKKNLIAVLSALVLLTNVACQSTKSDCATTACGKPAASKCEIPQLTKDMFYNEKGEFNQEAAKQAYIDMMERMGYPVSDNMRENMWAIDFGLGDFPAVGMGGIFWAHENEHGVFGHEILLLPNQFLVQHKHVPHANLPAKNECWQARRGVTYCFGDEGEDISKFPALKIPESQKPFFTSKKVTPACAKKGNVVWLNKLEAWHSQIAGPEGAIVTEYGCFHQNEGNRFKNTNVKF